MSGGFIYSIAIVAAIACGCNAVAQTENGRHVGAAASPTPEPVISDMPKSNQQETAKPQAGRATGFAHSGPVRDMPVANPSPSAGPREINPLNTLPIKGIKPAGGNTVIQKNKVRRPGKRKN